MTLFEGVPRLVRHPSIRYIVQPLTRWDYWRLWLYLRVVNVARRLLGIGPNIPCECSDVHPHPDWPR